jgi:hypothetical protein
MSDDIELFGPEMRKPAVISLVAGFVLALMAIQGHRIQGTAVTWWLMLPYWLLSTSFLYGVAYRNRKRRAKLS